MFCETQLIAKIKETINYPLAALVSRLRNKAEGKKITTDYIDDAREKLEDAIASSIVGAIKDVEWYRVESQGLLANRD